MNFIFLAAGKSSRIYNYIKKPKCLIQINKLSLIENLIKKIAKSKNNKIYIVTGFKSKMIKKHLKKYKNINFIENKFYKTKDMLYSLMVALNKIKGDSIISYTDIYFKGNIFKQLISKKKYIYLPILKDWKKVWNKRNQNVYKDAENLLVKKNDLLQIGNKIKKLSQVKFQYMGIFSIPENIRKKFLKSYKNYKNVKKMHITNFLNLLIKEGFKIKCVKVNTKWYEFDKPSDILNFN